MHVIVGYIQMDFQVSMCACNTASGFVWSTPPSSTHPSVHGLAVTLVIKR